MGEPKQYGTERPGPACVGASAASSRFAEHTPEDKALARIVLADLGPPVTMRPGFTGTDKILAHIQMAQSVARLFPAVWLALLDEDPAMLQGLRDELLEAALRMHAAIRFEGRYNTARETAFGLTQCLPGVELTPEQRSKLAAIMGASDE